MLPPKEQSWLCLVIIHASHRLWYSIWKSNISPTARRLIWKSVWWPWIILECQNHRHFLIKRWKHWLSSTYYYKQAHHRTRESVISHGQNWKKKHHIGKPRDNRPIEIIVKFVSCRDRALGYAKTKNLKTYNQNEMNDHKSFIEDSLLRQRIDLLFTN